MKKSIFLLIVLLLVATTTALGQKLNVDQHNATMLRQFQQQRLLINTHPAVTESPENLKNLEGVRSFQKKMESWMAKQKRSGMQINTLMRTPTDGIQLYQLDSIITVDVYEEDTIPYSRNSFTYDYNQRVTGFEFWTDYEQEIGWTNGERMMLEFNDNWDIISYQTDIWNPAINEWEIEQKMIMAYDESHNMTLMEQYARHEDEEGNMVFAGVMKMEYTYNNYNDWTLMIIYEWDWVADDWVPEIKMETRWEDGMEMMFASYQWDREKKIWIGHWMFDHEVVVSIEMMNSTYYHWDYEKDEWYIQDKTTYEVISFEDAPAVEMVYYGWDYVSETLVPYGKSIYYDPVRQNEYTHHNFRKTYSYSRNSITNEWIFSEHTIATISEHNLKTFQEHYIWKYIPDSTTNMWIKEWDTEFWYDNQQNLTESVYTNYNYSYSTNQLEINRKSKTLFEYNEQNLNTLRLYQNWYFGDSEWTNISKYTYSYNASGETIEELWFEIYDVTESKWIPSRKFEYDYNLDGETAMAANYIWDAEENDWQLNRKTENYIDEKGRITLSSESNWSYQLNKVILYFREENQWDASDRLVLHSYIWSDIQWDGSNYYQFINGVKETAEYDEYDRQVSENSWHFDGTDFQPDKKIVFFYHEQFPMALVLEHKYEWNVAASDWELIGKGELTFNLDVLRSQILVPFNNEEREAYRYFGHLPLSLIEYEYHKEGDAWFMVAKTELFYTANQFSSTDEMEQTNELKLFPNPAGDFLRIQLPVSAGNANMNIFDLHGRSVNEFQFKQNLEIDLRNLVPGIYFYRIVTATGTLSGKLLKQ